MSADQIGVLGGGQLGLMLLRHGSMMDQKFLFLDDDADCPVSRLNPGLFRRGSFRSHSDIKMFADECDVMTIEIEDVEVSGLKTAETMGVKVYPRPETIELIQDKGKQKAALAKQGLPVGDFFMIDKLEELTETSFPLFVKSRRSGYDGQGVIKLESLDHSKNVFPGPYLCERPVEIHKELAIQIVRNADGQMKLFPPVEMVFDERRNILDALLAPAQGLNPGQVEDLQNMAITIVEAFDYVGILAIEFFLTKDGKLQINEVSPRPHNSGHHTIHWSSRSQFEMHARAISNLPLPDIEFSGAALMINLLGGDDSTGTPSYHNQRELLNISNLYMELYGKNSVRPFRKMGHVTMIGQNAAELFEQRAELQEYFSVETSKKQPKEV